MIENLFYMQSNRKLLIIQSLPYNFIYVHRKLNTYDNMHILNYKF